MKIEATQQGEALILKPEGRITFGDGDQVLAETVRTQLEQGARRLVIDFSATTYLDSSGIGELVGCYTSVMNKGGELKLCGLNDRIFGLMKMTSLHSVFDVRGSVEEALAAFKK